MSQHKCPKCAGTMVEGYTPDEGHGWRRPAAWVEGAPVKSIWSGLSFRGKRQFAIRSLRCDRCGFLENYAPD